MSKELQTFLDTWDEETKKTVAMLQSLPTDKYDFRPDAGGRSLGELGMAPGRSRGAHDVRHRARCVRDGRETAWYRASEKS